MSTPTVRKRRHERHGMHGTREYWIWQAIIQRCTNPHHHKYPLYGGRGITVCDEWRDSFMAFYLAVGDRPSPRHSIDRIDNYKGYEPGNIRWATSSEQSNNRRQNQVVTYRGAKMTLTEAARKAGVVERGPARSRLSRGWTVEAAVETPPAYRRDKKTRRVIRTTDAPQ